MHTPETVTPTIRKNDGWQTCVLLLFLTVPVLQAQNATTTGPATATGQCAVSHSGNYDTITIQNCGIGAEQGKKIEDLLNKVLANRDMTDINAKLDRLLELISPPIIRAGSLKELPPSNDGHPRQSFVFYVERPDESGEFGVVCDRACTASDGCVDLPGQNSLHIGSLVADPRVAVFFFGRQFPALFSCTLSVESRDGNPIKILSITHLAITDARQVSWNAVQPHGCIISSGGGFC